MNLNIHYLCHGKGKPIIILPGYLLNSNHYKHLFDFFPNNLVYILDWPGFGISEDSFLTQSDYDKLLDLFISSLHIKNPVIVAHSFSGRIAILHSINSLDKICLVGTPGIENNSLLKKIKIALYKHFKLNFSSKDYKNSNMIQKRIMKDATSFKISKYLKDMKGEVLILHGKKDKTIKYSIAKRMNKEIPNSVLIPLNSDHNPFISNAYEISLIIEAFANG